MRYALWVMRAGLEIGTPLLVWGTPGPQSLLSLKLFHAPAAELVRKWRIESHRDGSLARYARLLPPI